LRVLINNLTIIKAGSDKTSLEISSTGKDNPNNENGKFDTNWEGNWQEEYQYQMDLEEDDELTSEASEASEASETNDALQENDSDSSGSDTVRAGSDTIRAGDPALSIDEVSNDSDDENSDEEIEDLLAIMAKIHRIAELEEIAGLDLNNDPEYQDNLEDLKEEFSSFFDIDKSESKSIDDIQVYLDEKLDEKGVGREHMEKYIPDVLVAIDKRVAERISKAEQHEPSETSTVGNSELEQLESSESPIVHDSKAKQHESSETPMDYIADQIHTEPFDFQDPDG